MIPLRDTNTPRLVARFALADSETPDSGGELRLLSDACFVFAPSPLLRDRLTQILCRADNLALRWGVTALYGLAVVGATLWCKEKKSAAGTAFVAAGSVAYWARRFAAAHGKSPPDWNAPVPFPKSDCTATTTAA